MKSWEGTGDKTAWFSCGPSFNGDFPGSKALKFLAESPFSLIELLTLLALLLRGSNPLQLSSTLSLDSSFLTWDSSGLPKYSASGGSRPYVHEAGISIWPVDNCKSTQICFRTLYRASERQMFFPMMHITKRCKDSSDLEDKRLKSSKRLLLATLLLLKAMSKIPPLKHMTIVLLIIVLRFQNLWLMRSGLTPEARALRASSYFSQPRRPLAVSMADTEAPPAAVAIFTSFIKSLCKLANFSNISIFINSPCLWAIATQEFIIQYFAHISTLNCAVSNLGSRSYLASWALQELSFFSFSIIQISRSRAVEGKSPGRFFFFMRQAAELKIALQMNRMLAEAKCVKTLHCPTPIQSSRICKQDVIDGHQETRRLQYHDC